ncbi:DUF6701 domain-containing protein [Glaciimonas immobilis]|uniref:DUF6701 domain-containing protein n=1 Tax=Glaciimonas immobilis TaxID=728004 RepID=A0A840RKU9_9BURK|nr:DUF6701 domain-containing protein [Glaciimonas immobilis]KAF3998986.1 hypothetical protein HAV38_03260 [Glaciimonas immobilis]MBB5198403.1 hypothetical protein [Glaciimonas immobilis]
MLEASQGPRSLIGHLALLVTLLAKWCFTQHTRWFLFIALPVLLLTALPAQAIDYTFPGALPAGCSGGNGSYTCGALTLAGGDTITITAPTTITVNGALSVGASSKINQGGSASDLIFVVSGAIGIGASTISTATLTSSAAINIGASSIISGNVSGSDVGAVSIGANSIVSGAVNTVTGAITIGAGSSVSSDITSSQTGTITLGANVQAGGNLNTNTGSIDVGAGSSIAGSVAISGSGAVTLGSTIKVGGSITTTSGAITLGASTEVDSLIQTKGGDAITFGANVIIKSLCCAATNDASCFSGNMPQPPPQICPKPNPPAAVSDLSTFDCLETSTNTPWDASARKPLFTKLVNASFSFDIAALKSDGTLATNYSASKGNTKSVLVQLFNDTTPPASCTALASQIPVASQTVTFGAGSAGRTQSGSFTVLNAAPILRCRVTECTDSSCASFTAVAPACSSDQFSVRPSAATLSTSAIAGAPSSSALPAINGSQGFALLASTNASTSYAGLLRLDTGKLTAQTPAQSTTQQSGGVVGVLTPFSLSANAAMVNATYSETGYLYLAPGAYRDDSFTSVDSANGDCITSTAGDSNLSDTLIGGKYGCSIGNQTALSFGRFVPDHFAVGAVPVTAACSATSAPFSYFGQDGFTANFSLTALTMANTITQNYTGAYAKLNPAIYANYAFTTSVLPAGSMLASGATGIAGSWNNGVASIVATLQISRPNAPAAETLVTIFAAPGDGEVTIGPPVVVGPATSLRYGRLKMQNAYGSELLALPVPLEAQYWTGSYYVTNTNDSCTVIPISSIKMSNYLKRLNACKTQLAPVGNITMVAGKLPGAGLVLTKPGVSNAGSVDLAINLTGAAVGNTCVGPAESQATSANIPWFGLNPGARATFGLYRSRFIYQREIY